MVVEPDTELLLGEWLLGGSGDLDLDLLVVGVPVAEHLLGERLLSGGAFGDLDLDLLVVVKPDAELLLGERLL